MFKNKDQALSLLLISPSLLAVLIFVYGFILWSGRVSLSDWKGLLPSYNWVGLKNFIELASDPRFRIDIRNTLIFTLIFVGGSLVLGLLLAILLDQELQGEGFFRSLFLFPMAISYIVTGVVWRWLMNPAMGSRMSGFNLLFDKLGLDFLINQWHTTPIWGIAAIALAALWQMSGFTMALYLAGLRAISQELREAARVDGASETQVYRHIVIPLLVPVTLGAMIILGHVSLKVFDLIVAVAGKQLPLDVPSIYMWQTTFDGLFFGRGAAIGIILLLSVAVLIIPYLTYLLRAETGAMTTAAIEKTGSNATLHNQGSGFKPRYLLYLPLLFMSLFYLVPLYVMLITGLKGFEEVSLRTMWDLPATIRFENFEKAFEVLAPSLWNSFNMVIPAAVISSILGSANGFVLSKWKFRGADIIFPLLLFGMFIPYQSILIPLVEFMRKIDLYGGLPGLVLTHVIYGIPITTLTFRNYYASIPKEMIEAARMDGAGLLGTYWHILLPISIPSFVVVLIWQFTSTWNDFLFAVVLTDPTSWPITVALNNMAGSQIIQWNVQMAGSFLAALPTLVVYIFLGRYFLRGLMAGALKG